MSEIVALNNRNQRLFLTGKGGSFLPVRVHSYIGILNKGDSKSLDTDFLDLISAFRIRLGEAIYKNNSNLGTRKIQYFIQIIINRILFVRILEDMGMEPENKLIDWLENGRGFWKQFHQCSKSEFYLKYDGALFEQQIPNAINIEDAYFRDFIISLYGKSPYRFDVIEPSLIAEIYDIFLGEELIFGKDTIKISYKKLSPTGSIPTPTELSTYISNKVLNLQNYNTIEEILEDIKILDPCAGSGSFLVVAYDCIVSRIVEIKKDDELSYELLKKIVKNCIYGVDIDPIAIEVLKMTISLKLIMSNYEPVEPIENMLSDFEKNFQLGNSIVNKDILDFKDGQFPIEERIEQKPTNYNEIFPEIMSNGGFTHILTNPPYIEPKHYRKMWPATYDYLKDKYVSNVGKSDVSLFFLERIFDLIKEEGKVGLVIQRRFFKVKSIKLV